MDENIRLAKKWVQKAAGDLLNADNNLNANWPFVRFKNIIYS